MADHAEVSFAFGDLEKTMNEPAVCPKCGGAMARGFIPDFGARGIVAEIWVEGRPQKSFWHVTKVSDEKSLPIASFRCSGCGYLESYARPEFGTE
jgi:predicted nucleic-acid-binding Zn-ribbon protein